jgi:hypothetical protein
MQQKLSEKHKPQVRNGKSNRTALWRRYHHSAAASANCYKARTRSPALPRFHSHSPSLSNPGGPELLCSGRMRQ